MNNSTQVRRIARRIAPFVMHPNRAIFAVWKRLGWGSFDLKCDLDLYDRQSYAYGVQQACDLARRLGHDAVSVLEFGVAGGNGLVALEQIAREASEAYGIRVEVYGFDRTIGLPTPLDHRDLPYTWRESFFEMDVPALQSRLQDAQLIIGDIAETVTSFHETHNPAPIGFVSIDVDYYSSAADSLKVFDGDDKRFLPRVLVYFDDVVGDDDQTMHNEYVGELCAMREFNEQHDDMKLGPIFGLAHKRAIPAAWNDSLMALHRFDHEQYGSYIGPTAEEQQLTLR